MNAYPNQQPYPQQPYQPQQPYPPQNQYGQQQPVFQVRVTKHTGMLIMFMNQRYTMTGTYEQCDKAISDALTHCLVAGWWSVLSVLVLNWIAIFANVQARKSLRQSAAGMYAYGRPAQ